MQMAWPEATSGIRFNCVSLNIRVRQELEDKRLAFLKLRSQAARFRTLLQAPEGPVWKMVQAKLERIREGHLFGSALAK